MIYSYFKDIAITAVQGVGGGGMVPFLKRRYTNRVPFLSKIIYKRVKGLDLEAELPGIKLC